MLIRRFLAALLLIVGLASASYALSPGAALVLNSSCANGASVAIDFTTGQTCGPAALTVTRAGNAYINDSAGNWSLVAANTLRRSDLGALIEESRTNSIRNDSMQGGVDNTSIPTGWGAIATTPIAGITRQSFVFGTEGNIEYTDVHYSGTASATTGVMITPEGSTQIVAANGQSWWGSGFISLVAGSMGDATVKIRTSFRDSGGIAVRSFDSAAIVPTAGTLGARRFDGGGTAIDATTAFVQPQLLLLVTSGNTYDFTIRYGWPQLELGAFVTSPIRTTSAAVARAADAVSLTSPPVFGSAFSTFVDLVTADATASRVSLGESLNNRLLYISGSNTQTRIFNGTTALIATAGSGGWTTGAKAASGFDTTGRAVVMMGGTVATDANSQPTPTSIYIGKGSDVSTIGSSYYRRVGLWANTRLPNATLQRLTAP